MKKLVLKLSTSLAALAFSVNQAFAQGQGGNGAAFFQNPQGGNVSPDAAAQGTLGENVITLINYFLGFLGLIAVAFLIYAGVLMVTAGGDEDQVGKARKIITYAVVGIVIILLSYTIVTFVTNALS